MRLLEIVNASDERARSITVQLEHDGEDVTHLLRGTPPASIAGRGRAAVLLSSAPGPQDVTLLLGWVDTAGIPGVWHGIVRRY